MKKYPKIIYIQKEEESNGSEYLLAWDKAEDANDGKIAIYELKEIKEKETKTIIK